MSSINKIEKFIQDHIEEIDKNLFLDLYLEAFNDFNVDDMIEFNKLLSDAGIDVESYRDNALNYLITMSVEDWTSGEGGVSAMPLIDFINIFLDNRLGLSIPYVCKYIENNSLEWKDSISIYKEHELLIIGKV